MLRVVFFDLGLTLVDPANRPFPDAPEAVDAIRQLTGAGGRPLLTALVSDFHLVAPPLTAAKIKPVFAEYLALLEATGFRPRFEPVGRRVTLSTHAGAMKPARVVFETALKRLRSTASLAACLFITEHAGHVAAARDALGMQALRFDPAAGPGADFSAWVQAPALVAHLAGGARTGNLGPALRRYLHVAHAFDLAEVTSASGPTVGVQGTLWWKAGESEAGQALLAPFPASGEVTLGADGHITAARFEEPAAASVREAEAFAGSLTRHAQIRGMSGPLGNPDTHAIEIDDQGRQKLVRTRFRAF